MQVKTDLFRGAAVIANPDKESWQLLEIQMFVFVCELDSFLSCTETFATDESDNCLFPFLDSPLICASAPHGIHMPCTQDVDCPELCSFHCCLTNDDTSLYF